jgi:hypothetical protein
MFVLLSKKKKKKELCVCVLWPGAWGGVVA